MKKLEIAIIYTAIFLSVVGENLSFGSHLRIQREVRERSALFQKVKEGRYPFKAGIPNFHSSGIKVGDFPK